MIRIIFHPEVDAELREATLFYKADRPQAAKAFTGEVKAAVARIRLNPLTGSPGEKGTRKKLLVHYPYTVIYRIHEDHAIVLAVAHHKRKEDYWHDRL